MRNFENLLVTGGCGFIGSNFVRYLFETAAFTGRIINVDKLTYAGNAENLADVVKKHAERCVFEQVDICDAENIGQILNKYHIDGICHLAAESHVDRSIAGPADFIQTNIIGTFTLLEAVRARQNQIKLFHHVSTDEVFGSLGNTGFFTESTAYKPNSPYSASKASSDHLVRAYGKTYGLHVTISNCSNNYGPYQFPEKLIPLMILNALDKKPLPVYGEGKNIRDWLYVEDHAEAIWRVMKKGQLAETYNIGGRCELTNIEVVKTICSMLNKLVPADIDYHDLITFVSDRPGHDHRYAIDCSKIKNDLSWIPQETFQSGLLKTMQWYLDHPQWVEHIKTGEYTRWISENYANRIKGTS